MASKIIVNEIEHSSGSSTDVAMNAANIVNLNTTNISSGTIGSNVIFPNQHIIRYGLASLATTPSALTATGSTDLITVSLVVPAAYNYMFVQFDFNYKLAGNSTSTNPYAYFAIIDVTDNNAAKTISKVKHVLPANTDEVIGQGTISAFFQVSGANNSYTVKSTQTWGEGSITTLGNSESDLTNPTTLTIGLTQGTPT